MSPELHALATKLAWKAIWRKFGWMCEDDKEDLAQAATVRAWRSGATDPRHLAVVVNSGVIDEFRRIYGRRPHTQKGRFHQASLDEYESEYYVGKPDDYAVDLESILSVLTERERVIVTRRMEGYKMHEIGEELGVSECRICQLCMDIRARIKHSRLLEAA